jgi:hypothetical protein
MIFHLPEKLKALIDYATDKIAEFKEEDVVLIHHDDADGICSAAMISEVLSRKKYKVERICLEKLFPSVVEKIHSLKGKKFFYIDIGSAHAKFISNVNSERNLVVILDHHDAEESTSGKVLNINPELFGISGEEDCSAGGICYLFSKSIDEKNCDLSYLAIVASCELPKRGKIDSLILKEAIDNKIVERRGNKFYIKKFDMSVDDFFSKLQILGPVGYYQNGPEIGVKACLRGFDEETQKLIKNLEEKRKLANKKLLSKIYRDGLYQTKNVQWFHAENNFKDMGTKVLGTFCSYLSFQRIANKEKYLVGFMNASSSIPKLGDLGERIIKVSARVPEALKESVQKKRMPSLSSILMSACREVGGFGDGHAFAASGIIPAGKEKEFVEKLQVKIDEYEKI